MPPRWRYHPEPEQCPTDVQHRQVKYLNNVVEADHGKLKQLIKPVRGFKTMKSAYATIKGFEVMRALRKGQKYKARYGGGSCHPPPVGLRPNLTRDHARS